MCARVDSTIMIGSNENLAPYQTIFEYFMHEYVTHLYADSTSCQSWEEVASHAQRMIIACTSIMKSDSTSEEASNTTNLSIFDNNNSVYWWLNRLLCLNEEKDVKIEELLSHAFDVEHCYRWVHGAQELTRNKEDTTSYEEKLHTQLLEQKHLLLHEEQSKEDNTSHPSTFNVLEGSHSRLSDVVMQYIKNVELPSSVNNSKRCNGTNKAINNLNDDDDSDDDDDDDDNDVKYHFVKSLCCGDEAKNNDLQAPSTNNNSSREQNVLYNNFVSFIHVMQKTIFDLHHYWIELPNTCLLCTPPLTSPKQRANTINDEYITKNDKHHKDIVSHDACNDAQTNYSLSEWKRLVHIERPLRPSEELIAEMQKNLQDDNEVVADNTETNDNDNDYRNRNGANVNDNNQNKSKKNGVNCSVRNNYISAAIEGKDDYTADLVCQKVLHANSMQATEYDQIKSAAACDKREEQNESLLSYKLNNNFAVKQNSDSVDTSCREVSMCKVNDRQYRSLHIVEYDDDDDDDSDETENSSYDSYDRNKDGDELHCAKRGKTVIEKGNSSFGKQTNEK